jgi:hypothetical protein
MRTLVAALAIRSAPSAAALACTQEEMTTKAQDYVTKFQTLAQKDPKKATAGEPANSKRGAGEIRQDQNDG